MSYHCPHCNRGWIEPEDSASDPTPCTVCEGTGWLNDDADRKVQAEEHDADVENWK